MPGYKHYINPKEPGQTCFVTATCLDFAHLFGREEMRTRMCISLLQDCKRWNATLSGFVVMTHHIHLVVRPDSDKDIAHLMNEIKTKSCQRLSSFLLPSEAKQMSMQVGLNRHNFWQRSFRANPLHTSEVYEQKLHYLHENPVRASLVEVPEQYLWSSLHVLQQGFFVEDGLVDIVGALCFYQDLLNSR